MRRSGTAQSAVSAATGARAAFGGAGSPVFKPGTASAAAALVSAPTPSSAPGSSKSGLTTRMLLLFYKLEDVQRFLEIFARVDENFSGDLDMEEWTSLFKSISNNIPAQEARSIFMKFKNEDGFLSMKELAPVVFSKASKEQLRLIVAHCNSEIIKKAEGLTQLTFNELESLFETFDTNNFGYVAVSTIRDEIRNLTLPDSIINSCLGSFKYVEDDEMISPSEFTRFFKMYISKAELLSQKTAEIKERFKTN
jgi:Ca2+-binding EF-hand superfamily protein